MVELFLKQLVKTFMKLVMDYRDKIWLLQELNWMGPLQVY